MCIYGTKVVDLGETAKPIVLKDVKGSEKVLSVDMKCN